MGPPDPAGEMEPRGFSPGEAVPPNRPRPNGAPGLQPRGLGLPRSKMRRCPPRRARSPLPYFLPVSLILSERSPNTITRR